MCWWASAARASSAGSGPADGEPPAAGDRLEASLALATWAMARGAAMVRVHDVAPTLEAARLVGGEWEAAA